jgi:hypothetical protein
MKCPRCNGDHTRLSWLREFAVIYWCTTCHASFELSRHRSRVVNPPSANGHSVPPIQSTIPVEDPKAPVTGTIGSLNLATSPIAATATTR